MINKLKEYLLEETMTEKEFNYIETKTKRVNIDVYENLDMFGCFVLTDEIGNINDFRVFVPTIKNLKSLLVNIHEFTHAIIVYRHIFNNEEYDSSEIKPIENEKKYILKHKQ